MREHEAWLEFATQDIKAALRLVQDPHEPLVQPAMVLAQQAAEKALKGFLFFNTHPLVKTHDLVYLVELCMEYDPEFEQLIEYAESLNPHISASRYPDTCFIMPDLTTATILVKQAAHIYNFINLKL